MVALVQTPMDFLVAAAAGLVLLVATHLALVIEAVMAALVRHGATAQHTLVVVVVKAMNLETRQLGALEVVATGKTFKPQFLQYLEAQILAAAAAAGGLLVEHRVVLVSSSSGMLAHKKALAVQ